MAKLLHIATAWVAMSFIYIIMAPTMPVETSARQPQVAKTECQNPRTGATTPRNKTPNYQLASTYAQEAVPKPPILAGQRVLSYERSN